jgi:hypothetical protein
MGAELMNMKLHEEISLDDRNYSTVLRVPGGWIYTFYQLEQHEGPRGSHSENYRLAAVFVPLNNEFNQPED